MYVTSFDSSILIGRNDVFRDDVTLFNDIFRDDVTFFPVFVGLKWSDKHPVRMYCGQLLRT